MSGAVRPAVVICQMYSCRYVSRSWPPKACLRTDRADALGARDRGGLGFVLAEDGLDLSEGVVAVKLKVLT
jgi:hypothetical protein